MIFNIYVHNVIRNIYYILLITYLFEMLKLEADELTSIHKYDVIDWYNSFLNETSLKYCRLCIHVWGCNGHKDDVANSTKLGNVIHDILAISSLQFCISSVLIAMALILCGTMW